MNRKCVIRPYQPGDEGEIVELLHTVFEGWPPFDLDCTPLEHWKWKYLDNPFKRSWIVVAKAQDRLVGCSHAIPITIKVGDRDYYSSQGYDLAVHPEYRGRRLSSKMSETRNHMREKDGVEFTPFETGSPIHRRFLEKRFPMFPRKMAHFIRIVDVDLHFENRPTDNEWLKKMAIKILGMTNVLKRYRGTKFSKDIGVTRVIGFTNEIVQFWEELKHQYNYCVKRDYEYLNWRYCDPRGGEYVIYVAREADKVLGYVVLRINRYDPDYPRGCIVDLQAPINLLGVAGILIDKAIRYFDENGINSTVMYMVEGHPYIRILRRYGFVNSRRTNTLFYSLHTMDQEEFQKVSESPSSKIWYCYGDRDGI